MKDLYSDSRSDAKEWGELDLWRESYKENCACARAIEKAIAENFDGMHLNADTFESPSSTRLEALVPSRDSRARTRSPRHAHGDLTSLAPHERLPEILVVPREKTPTGAAARGNP